jgi:signal transduction histidine kinase
MVAAITGFYSVRQNAQAVRMSSNENILWAAFQIEVELLRFLETLATYETGTELNPEYVNHRFDILWSRLAVFQSGTVGQRLLHYDRDKQVISQMAETMRKTESLVVGLSSGDPSVALEIAAEFQAFPIPLRLLSRDVMHGEVKAEAGVRKALATSVMVLLILSSAAVVASLALLAIFWRDSVRFRQIALQNEELLHTATMANESKEKFLTMMSHELRTPMNGVLWAIGSVGTKSDLKRAVAPGATIGTVWPANERVVNRHSGFQRLANRHIRAGHKPVRAGANRLRY